MYMLSILEMLGMFFLQFDFLDHLISLIVFSNFCKISRSQLFPYPAVPNITKFPSTFPGMCHLTIKQRSRVVYERIISQRSETELTIRSETTRLSCIIVLVVRNMKRFNQHHLMRTFLLSRGNKLSYNQMQILCGLSGKNYFLTS